MNLQGLPTRRGEVQGTLVAFCPHRLTVREGIDLRTYGADDRDRWGIEVQYRGDWVTPSQLQRLVESAGTLVSDSYAALAESLLEAKAHYPFKRKSKLGPGPRNGKNKKTQHWDCNCSNDGSQTVCDCDDLTGETNGRIVKIPLSYKREYNKEYRAWLAKKAKKKAAAKKVTAKGKAGAKKLPKKKAA